MGTVPSAMSFCLQGGIYGKGLGATFCRRDAAWTAIREERSQLKRANPRVLSLRMQEDPNLKKTDSDLDVSRARDQSVQDSRRKRTDGPAGGLPYAADLKEVVLNNSQHNLTHPTTVKTRYESAATCLPSIRHQCIIIMSACVRALQVLTQHIIACICASSGAAHSGCRAAPGQCRIARVSSPHVTDPLPNQDEPRPVLLLNPKP